MDAVKQAFSKKERNSLAMQSFGHRMRMQFDSFAAYRRVKELEWLEDLRQYKGVYGADVKIAAGNSRVYPKITRSKVNIALSRLHEMLFPEREKNWEIAPTPDPKISKETIMQIARSLVKPPEMDPKTGQPSAPKIPTKEELRLAVAKYAKDTCEKMSVVIDDQLTEMEYPEETKKVLKFGLKLGTGVMKGPMTGTRSKRIWEPTDDGDFEETEDKEEVPDLEFVRLWDWYPDMSVTELKDIEGSYERHIMTKHDIRQLAKREDFYPEMIETYLKNNPHGNYVPATWETELQIIEYEASTKGGSTSRYSTNATNPLDDGNQGASRPVGKKYEVLEFWGYVDGADLEACGIPDVDVTLEYAANIWVLPGRGDGASCPIKAVLYPGALDHYKVFYFEKDETSIFGEGLARIMKDSQKAIAGAARMVLDNGACVAGPQVEVNWSLMTPDTDTSSFYPRKIWYREGKGVDASYPAMRIYNIESHIEELIQIIDLFKQFGDEETTLPTWMIGQGVNNETAQATSGRMSMTLAAVKDIVRNFDTFTEGVIRALYAWNMDFNPRTDIKGDFKCKARGSSSLVMKEIRMQALAQLSTTLTPEERDYIPERDFLQEKMRAHDINITLLSDEEVAAKRKAAQESIQTQLAIEFQKSEIEKNKAQSLSLTTKAKEHNVLAIKEAQTPIETPPGDNPDLQAAEAEQGKLKAVGEAERIRRENESHALEMTHRQEDHALEHGIKKLKTVHEVAGKDKMTEHGMKMKETMTQASAQAKKTAAKLKPKAPKKETKK